MPAPAQIIRIALGDPPPPAFAEALPKRAVAPLPVGHVIVATWEPNEMAVLEAIRRQFTHPA